MEKLEKEPRKLVLRITPWIFLLILPLLIYVHVLCFQSEQRNYSFIIVYTYSGIIFLVTIEVNSLEFAGLHYFTGNRKVMQLNTSVEENQESLYFLLSRLMKGIYISLQNFEFYAYSIFNYDPQL